VFVRVVIVVLWRLSAYHHQCLGNMLPAGWLSDRFGVSAVQWQRAGQHVVSILLYCFFIGFIVYIAITDS
jgi:hypothetical protein